MVSFATWKNTNKYCYLIFRKITEIKHPRKSLVKLLCLIIDSIIILPELRLIHQIKEKNSFCMHQNWTKVIIAVR